VGVDRKHQPVVARAVAQGFQRADYRQAVRIAAAVFGRNRQALNAQVRSFLPGFPGKFRVAVALDQAVVQFLLRETDYFAPKSCLLITPGKFQCASLSSKGLIPAGPILPSQNVFLILTAQLRTDSE